MGSRADFYIGKEPKVENWLGSIAWDGYPDGIPKSILKADFKGDYKMAVLEFLRGREDATFPKDGWPWPWNDSNTTDYAYTFTLRDKVRASNFGSPWYDPNKPPKDIENLRGKAPVFPDMKDIKNVNFGDSPGSSSARSSEVKQWS